MPLTPDDIRHVQFRKQVDQLLDAVETTLRTRYARIAELENRAS